MRVAYVQDEAMKIFLIIMEFNNLASHYCSRVFQSFIFKNFVWWLQEKGYTKIPKGLKGITSVYKNFIDTVDDKLHGSNYLDYSKHQKKVHKAIDIIIELLNKKNSSLLNMMKPIMHSKQFIHQLQNRNHYYIINF